MGRKKYVNEDSLKGVSIAVRVNQSLYEQIEIIGKKDFPDYSKSRGFSLSDCVGYLLQWAVENYRYDADFSRTDRDSELIILRQRFDELESRMIALELNCKQSLQSKQDIEDKQESEGINDSSQQSKQCLQLIEKIAQSEDLPLEDSSENQETINLGDIPEDRIDSPEELEDAPESQKTGELENNQQSPITPYQERIKTLWESGIAKLGTIAKILTDEKIKTPGGSDTWQGNQVERVLITMGKLPPKPRRKR